MDVVEQTKKKMQGALDHLKSELKGLRTGRASHALVEHVMVEVYGTKMRIQDLATISVPESRQLLITPFDGTNSHAIAKAIDAANLNVLCATEGNMIRIKVPEMSTSVRQDMIKQAKRKNEETKIAIRNVRRESNEEVKKQKAIGTITEDVVSKLEKSVQELTDKFCKQSDDITLEKEKEIQTIWLFLEERSTGILR